MFFEVDPLSIEWGVLTSSGLLLPPSVVGLARVGRATLAGHLHPADCHSKRLGVPPVCTNEIGKNCSLRPPVMQRFFIGTDHWFFSLESCVFDATPADGIIGTTGPALKFGISDISKKNEKTGISGPDCLVYRDV